MPTAGSRPVALITGGTTGIGLATAHVLHAEGYAVLVTGQNPETLAPARSALPEDIVVFRADSRSIADAERVAFLASPAASYITGISIVIDGGMGLHAI